MFIDFLMIILDMNVRVIKLRVVFDVLLDNGGGVRIVIIIIDKLVLVLTMMAIIILLFIS